MANKVQSKTIDDKIEAAQDKVYRAKCKYEAAVAELKDLMARKSAMMREEIMNAIDRSGKSYDEILAYLKSDSRCE